MSAISLGSWTTLGDRLDERSGRNLFNYAYDCGINLFDTAEIYADGRAEAALGSIISAWPRESVVLCTKAMWGTGDRRPNTWGLSRKHLFDACNASLRRLKSDYIDLFLCHRPDDRVPLEETVAAMGDLVRQGKVLYWGTSEWPATSIVSAMELARDLGVAGPTTEQSQYNLFTRRRLEIEYRALLEGGLGAMVWSPLASGLLSGREVLDGGRLADPAYQWVRKELLGERETHRMLAGVRLRALAQRSGLTTPALAFAFCLQNGCVSSVIAGASAPLQLDDVLVALNYLPLSPEMLAELDVVSIDGCAE